MMARQGDGSGGMSAETTLRQKGMKTRSAEPPGKMKMGGSVNDEATRKETAPTPKTLGDGRVA
jgi:hypothetical protein